MSPSLPPASPPRIGRNHFDLSEILQKNWSTLGSKPEGKIHVYVGSADTYFLNDGVYYLENVLNVTANPTYGGEVKYGARAEHCWSGFEPTSKA